jgi:putative intracellular protease/amidase
MTKRRKGPTAALLLLLLVFLAPGSTSSAEAPAAKHYVCPPCGLPCDGKVYDEEGVCPTCGMKLVEQGEANAAAPTSARPRVALLVFTGVQIIDFTGPYEIFGTAGYDVYTVAETKDPITTVNGMTVVPKYDFATVPPPDVLVVPGGGIYAASNSPKTIQWIADVTGRTKHTMSVCNGAFLLAQAGLLDGLTATTTAGLIEKLGAQYPKVHVVNDRRFVDNGKIITTAGLSAGIDGALHVIARMQGNGKAELTALGDEYEWKPEPGFARASLADRNIPDLDPDGKGQWTVESTRGGTDRWEIVLRGKSNRTAPEVAAELAGALSDHGKWTSVPGKSSPTSSGWKFTGRDGKAWTGSLTVAPGKGPGDYTAKVAIARAG